MSRELGPGPHTRVRRLPEKAAYDEATVHAIVDAADFCHVAAVVDGVAVALPTLHYREGGTLYVHASKSNGILRSCLASGFASASVTLLDGLRVARSGFESSIAYRSAVVMGPTREVVNDDEKTHVLTAFVDAVIPGRSSEVRPMTSREVNLTLVMAIDIAEASAKVSSGPTGDDDEDAALPIWSGTVPIRRVFLTPEPDSTGAMSSGEIPVPPSIRRLLEEQS